MSSNNDSSFMSDCNIDFIMERLIDFANEPEKLKAWQENAFKTYHGHFSEEKVMDKWNMLLRDAS